MFLNNWKGFEDNLVAEPPWKYPFIFQPLKNTLY